MRRRPPTPTRTDTLFPYTTLVRSERRARITRRLGFEHDAFRAHREVGIEEGLSLRTAVHRQFPVLAGAMPVLADGAEHRLAADDLVVAPGQHRIACGPGVGQEPGDTRQQRFEALIGRELAHATERRQIRSEEHTSELQSLMRISYAVFCLKKKNKQK